MRPLLALALAATVTFALLAGFLGEASAAEPAKLIVRFGGDATAADRLDARQETGTELDRALPVKGMQLVEVEPGSRRPRRSARSSATPTSCTRSPTPSGTRSRSPTTRTSQLWAVQNTGQLIRGVAGTPDADSDIAEAWEPGITGNTIVAVIDTGVDTAHPDLRPNLLPGHDYVGNDDDPSDENGHGTHVSGTIAAERGNGIGVAGVADNAAKVLPIRTLDANGSGSVSNVILAYSYAFQHGAKVVNLSLGSTSSSRAERDAIAAFPTMLFVAAAGNGGADGVGDDNDVVPTYPCAYVLPNVLCVAASDNRDQLASFSNYGATSVDLAAPGVSIASTWMGGGYSWASGTSMATPHVSGAAALLWSASPSSLPTDISSAITGGTDARPRSPARRLAAAG